MEQFRAFLSGVIVGKSDFNLIEGKIKEPYSIVQKKCIKCGACLASCTFNAITEVY